MQAHTAFREGRGEIFSLDILFHRMSVIEMFRQLTGVAVSGHPRTMNVHHVPPLRGDVSAHFSAWCDTLIVEC